MKFSADYRRVAREKLANKWGGAIFACFLYSLITSALSIIPGFGSVAAIVISGPLTIGLTFYFIKLHAGEKPSVGMIFEGFNDFVGSLAVYVLTAIYTLLWSLLLVIPGIMKSYSYSMAFYLKAKRPELTANEAITLSSEIMYGKRFRLFCLQLSFIGWAILSVLTFGIGLFFLLPYMQAANTAFYEEAYAEYAGPETVVLSENDVVVTSAPETENQAQPAETREEQVSKIINESNIKSLEDYADNDGDH